MSKTRGWTSELTLPQRAALSAHWYELTREILPAMAYEKGWPISLDHCFMRVCLDAVIGTPWHETVARPAITNMSDGQLAAAVRTAEAIVADPAELVRLNERSLGGRRALKRRSSRR